MKPCKHTNTEFNCRICWLALNNIRLRELWGVEDDKVIESLDKPNVDMVKPTVRNLLYHIYPRKNSCWRNNLLLLRERIGLFNGKRVIAIAYDQTTEYPVMVKDALSGANCEFVEVKNNPERREVETFLPLFSRVKDLTDPDQCTLYAQCKGTTRLNNPIVTLWHKALIETYLDYWPEIEKLLCKYPTCGSFKKTGSSWSYISRSNWHYSGSWFWFRNRELFSKPDWKNIDQFWGGIEAYPSLHFNSSEAGVIFHESKILEVNLYHKQSWDRYILPQLQSFKIKAHKTNRVLPESRLLNVGCGPHYFPNWCNTDTTVDSNIKPDVLVEWLQPMPFEDSYFERAYCGHVLEHIPWERVNEFLTELKRVVRSNGQVMIVGPDFNRALDRFEKNPNEHTRRHIWEVGEDMLHYQHMKERTNWNGARHFWVCYEKRIVHALEEARFTDVQPMEMVPESFIDWPLVDLIGAQCGVKATVP